MNNIRIDVMIKYLKHSAIQEDKAVFIKWEEGLIDTAECIQKFRKHNNITERMPILEDDFKAWLNGLGYIRSDD